MSLPSSALPHLRHARSGDVKTERGKGYGRKALALGTERIWATAPWKVGKGNYQKALRMPDLLLERTP